MAVAIWQSSVMDLSEFCALIKGDITDVISLVKITENDNIRQVAERVTVAVVVYTPSPDFKDQRPINT